MTKEKSNIRPATDKKERCLWCKRVDMGKWDESGDRRWCKKHGCFISPKDVCDDWRYLG